MTLHSLHLRTPVPNTFRVQQVAGLFDLPLEQLESRLAHSLTVELPGLDEDWTIGAIVGPSGSGKTTLARAVYGNALYEPQPWPADDAIIDGLGDCASTSMPIKSLARVLTAVGLGSVPTWLKPYRVLSTGEQFRANLARAVLAVGERDASASRSHSAAAAGSLAREHDREAYASRSPGRRLLVIDEFTSTLDRTVAMTASAALARLLRNPPSEIPNPKWIVLTCHRDILPWLEPDWTLDLSRSRLPDGTLAGKTISPDDVASPGKAASPGDARSRSASGTYSSGTYSLTRGRLRRPTLRLAVRRVRQKLWAQFARHHYLAGGLAASATCYAAFWEEEPVAFCAALASLGWKKSKRITRLVTLPTFQGLGIASRLAETVAAHEAAQGHRVSITASHPAILAHCARSPRWRYLGLKKTGSTRQQLGTRTIRCSAGRAVASFAFVPAGEWEA